MRVKHRISVDLNPHTVERFQKLGFNLEAHRVPHSSFSSFDMFETDPLWPKISRVLAPIPKVDVVHSVFTKAEIEAAEFLTMSRRWDWGYPQPEDSYQATTYVLSEYCCECGIGRKQKAPFRMLGEPKWGKRSILCLHWVPDELFVTLEGWEKVFKPFGVKSRPVLKLRGGGVLQTCVQLVIDKTAEVQIPDAHPGRLCPVCGHKKWKIFTTGFFPAPISKPTTHLLKSSQYFGDGYMAYKHVIFSRELHAAILDHGLKGPEFSPCAPS